jgi:LPXTG-site transpeptidase (sortase) family protein
MSDGAYAPLDEFIDRSRFRQRISISSYEPRKTNYSRSLLISDVVRRKAERQKSIAPKVAKPQMPSQSIKHTPVQVAEDPVEDLSVVLDSLDYASKAPAVESNQAEPKHINHRKQSRFHVSKSFSASTNKLRLGFIGLALLMVATGAYISFSAWQTNKTTQLAAKKLTAAANLASNSGSGTKLNSSQALSTVKPTPAVLASYAVAPNFPKYLKIPSIGVDARVLQVGILSSGALGTPDNVFNTAWYTGSAQPGQPGATLIDGHVSSWTSHGVFYNLHNLKAGDMIQIVKGDNSVVNYQVVKTQIYNAQNVNMQAAITPINPSVSGLNLITCTGQVIKGTSTFNQRVIVFAQEVS